MKNITKWTLSFLILMAAFIWAQAARSPLDNSARLFFFNVGQGDAILIQKGSEQILIDGGPDDKVLSELGKVMPLSDRKIETVILTHPHADHLAGFNQVLDRYEVGTIYFSGAVYTTNGYLEFLQKIKDKGIDAKVPLIGDSVSPFPDGNLTFLWPGDQFKGETPENLNNVSEVAKFCYFDQCALLTGDIETDEQKEMFEYYSSSTTTSNSSSVRETKSSSFENDLPSQNIPSEAPTPSISPSGRGRIEEVFASQILKLSHHGSTNGTDDQILNNIKPAYAVIEVGADNKFGHPHAPVFDLLKAKNIQTLRTDRDGTIEFVLTQEGIAIKK